MHRTANQLALKDLNEAIKSGKMRVTIPLVGFRQRPSMGMQGEIENQVLKEEDVSPDGFKIRAMPEISAKGKLRTVLTLLNNFSIKEISNDPTVPSEKEVKTGFMLHRGSYATILLRELMKPRNLIKAGF
jgi:tRNA pseudouridine13 synthase